jgi:hypothetical protein
MPHTGQHTVTSLKTSEHALPSRDQVLDDPADLDGGAPDTILTTTPTALRALIRSAKAGRLDNVGKA